MKTPDEIRAGLGCCYVLHSCKGCPYDEDGCIPALWEDSVSYIGQLEAGQHFPLRKPLTREELTKSAYQIPCWIEGIGEEEMAADVLDRDSAGLLAKLASSTVGFAIHCDMDEYGIFWRAWAQRPTDEERAAAPWEAAGDADL